MRRHQLDDCRTRRCVSNTRCRAHVRVSQSVAALSSPRPVATSASWLELRRWQREEGRQRKVRRHAAQLRWNPNLDSTLRQPVQPAWRWEATAMESRAGPDMAAAITGGRGDVGIAKRRRIPSRVSATELLRGGMAWTSDPVEEKARRHQPAAGTAAVNVAGDKSGGQGMKQPWRNLRKGSMPLAVFCDTGRPCHWWRMTASSSGSIGEAMAIGSDTLAGHLWRESRWRFSWVRQRAGIFLSRPVHFHGMPPAVGLGLGLRLRCYFGPLCFGANFMGP